MKKINKNIRCKQFDDKPPSVYFQTANERPLTAENKPKGGAYLSRGAF